MQEAKSRKKCPGFEAERLRILAGKAIGDYNTVSKTFRT